MRVPGVQIENSYEMFGLGMKRLPIRVWYLNWRVLVAAGVILLGSSSSARIYAADAGGVEVQNEAPARPGLIFACDGPTSELQALLTPDLIADLKILNAGVALSTEDFSRARAEIVRRLNVAGIPVTAWILLPPEQGYYSNADNAPQTLSRFTEFDSWTRENNLQWAAVGLDIEPNFSQLVALKNHKMHLLWVLFRRSFDAGRVRRAQDAYSAVIRQIQSRGYLVQTYQLPFLADERNAHSTVLERVLGLVDVRGNDEVLMIYTSFNHKMGSAMIWEYGPDAQTIAVGSTASAGNAATDAAFPPLNWDEFSSDLIVAHHFSAVIAVYNLQGCVRQGFIARLKVLNWSEPVLVSSQSITRAARLRSVVHLVLWIGSNLIYLAAGAIVLIAWLAYRIARRRRRRRAEMLTVSVG